MIIRDNYAKLRNSLTDTFLEVLIINLRCPIKRTKRVHTAYSCKRQHLLYLGPRLLARVVRRVPAVDVLLPLEDIGDRVLYGAGLLKGQKILAVTEYLGLPAMLANLQVSRSSSL